MQSWFVIQQRLETMSLENNFVFNFHSWAADARSRPAFRSLCEAFRNISVRRGDLISVTLPDLPNSKQENKVSKAIGAAAREGEEPTGRGHTALLGSHQQAIQQAEKDRGGKKKAKSDAKKQDAKDATKPVVLELNRFRNT